MELTRNNYFSKEAENLFMGSSSFKAWDIEHGGCEAKEVAKHNGEWKEKENPAFLLGTYVHAWSSEELEEFKVDHPELFKKDKTLYAKYALGDKMIETFESDETMMQMRKGEKEKIFIGKIAGVDFKIQVDILNVEHGYFADIKTTKNIREKYWNNELKTHENFIQKYDYPLQFAIYAEILRQNLNMDEWLDSYVLAVDKQDIPDHEVIYMGTDFIKSKLEEIERKLPHIIAVRNGEIEPKRCGKCDYCRSTKKIQNAIHYLEL
jgi:hypothetical protein